MPINSLTRWTHDHAFLGVNHSKNERRTWVVVAFTVAMMIAEVIGGAIYGSMALVADGWHMATHAGALAIAALAYRYARSHVADTRFSFGTGKVCELAGYSSALILAGIAVLIGYESALRFFHPVPISFDEAIVIAVLGLAVNVLSAWLLQERHEHTHEHEDGHHDHNLRAAYLHVLADAVTSLLAIIALLAGRFYGWVFMDPIMGVIGAILIVSWAAGLLRSSGAVLLDTVVDVQLAGAIRKCLEVGTDRVTDLHVWRVGPGHAAVIATVISDRPQPPDLYKSRLRDLRGLSHVTIEVHACAEV